MFRAGFEPATSTCTGSKTAQSISCMASTSSMEDAVNIIIRHTTTCNQSTDENIGSLFNNEQLHSLYPRSTDWMAEILQFDSRQGQEILHSVQTGFQLPGRKADH
jgi:hypothetical protein